MAIVFRPVRGEVVDSIVTSVHKLGFYTQCGPLAIFISRHRIPMDMEFVGDNTAEKYFISKDDPENRIAKGDEIRVRVLGLKEEPSHVYAIGTIDDSYLGPF